MEQLENDLMTSRFLVAHQSSYGRVMVHVMNTFFIREKELSNMSIRGQNLKPKVFLENQIQLRFYSRIIINLTKETQGFAN